MVPNSVKFISKMNPPKRNFNRWSARLTPKAVAFSIFFLLIIIYAFYQTYALAEGPDIAMEQPTTNGTITDPLVTIAGQAERISHLFLNGGQIFTDESGHFREKLLLAPGYNLITLLAKDKFSREIERRIELVYSPIN